MTELNKPTEYHEREGVLKKIKTNELCIKYVNYASFTFCLISGLTLISSPVFIKTDFALLHSNDMIRGKALSLLFLLSGMFLLKDYIIIHGNKKQVDIPYLNRSYSLEQLQSCLKEGVGLFSAISVYRLLDLKMINPSTSKYFLVCVLLLNFLPLLLEQIKPEIEKKVILPAMVDI